MHLPEENEKSWAGSDTREVATAEKVQSKLSRLGTDHEVKVIEPRREP